MSYGPNTTVAGSLDTGFWGRLGSACLTLPARVVQRIRTHMRNRRDYRDLLEMPDYLLDDVGLTRDQILSETKRTFFH